MADIIVRQDAIGTNVIVSGTNAGSPGTPATIAVGTVASGTTPSVTNTGTSSAAILNFVIPKGDKGDAGSSSAITRTITQASHGLAAGDCIQFDGNKYIKAKADTLENAEVIGMVASVTNANAFVICTEGYVTGLAGLASGQVYYLSPATAGALTTTEPSTAGQVSKPLFTSDSATSGYFHNYRGILVV